MWQLLGHLLKFKTFGNWALVYFRITVLRPKELGLMQKFGLKPKETARYGNGPK